MHEQTTAITIMHVLNRIIGSDTASNQVRTRACFILRGFRSRNMLKSATYLMVSVADHLVSDNRVFCQLAYERNSLHQIANLVNDITPTEKSSDFEEDEPESVSRLREVSSHLVYVKP